MDALDAIQKGAPLSDEVKKNELATLNALEQQAHNSQLTIPELQAFQKLVEAAGGVCAK